MYSTLSKTVAAVVTYPYQVVRARLQMHGVESVFESSKDVIVKTYKNEGLLGFYKGLIPSLLRVLPGTIITFTVYENTSALMDYLYK